MGDLNHAEGFRDLVVYQKARSVAREVFEISKIFPKEESYSLSDQIRRASRSVGAHIAEAWAKRRYVRHFVSKLTDADGEQLETQHWIDIAVECGYIGKEQGAKLVSSLSEVGRMLNGMIQKGTLFCGNAHGEVHESAAAYFVKAGK